MSSRATYASRLDRIAARVEAGIEPAVERSAERIKTSARINVPVGPPRVHIRDTIRVRGKGHQREVVAGSRKAFYGHILEWGAVHMAARPFMTPAAETERASRKLERDITELFE